MTISLITSSSLSLSLIIAFEMYYFFIICVMLNEVVDLVTHRGHVTNYYLRYFTRYDDYFW